MTRKQFLAFTLGLAGAVVSVQQAFAQEREREKDRDRDREGRDRDDKDHRRAEYHFRREDGARLREHYREIDRVDMHRRERFVAGERLPGDWRRRLRPVPEVVVRELPPPPRGYAFGYFDGFCVVYDPNSGYIADVIDLTNIR